MKNNFTLFGQIQTSQIGGQPYSDASPFGECSLPNCYIQFISIGWNIAVP